MKMWDVATKTHDVLAHTGLFMPHAEQRYPDNGELRWPNEIDLPLITLGRDRRRGLPAGAGRRDRPVRRPGPQPGRHREPLRPRPEHAVLPGAAVPQPTAARPTSGSTAGRGRIRRPASWRAAATTPRCRRRPRRTTRASAATRPGPPGALQADAAGAVPRGHHTGPGLLPHRRPDSSAEGRYRIRERPDAVADRPAQRAAHRQGAASAVSPLGDPVPFSAYLIGRLVNDTGYETQFNLDADRAYALPDLGLDPPGRPAAAGQDADELPLPAAGGTAVAGDLPHDRQPRGTQRPMQLDYVDPPPVVIIEDRPARGEPPRRSSETQSPGGES